MSNPARLQRIVALGVSVMVATTACTFQGVNSLPLPGAVGRGPGAGIYHAKIANIATLESNSPVMISDIIVGSVGTMTFSNWHADVELWLKPGVVVPANAVARIGQTSLLGSMHVSLDPPLGQSPVGHLAPGATIPLSQSFSYPSTEQTLASLSAVVNGGALGQVGDIIHNLNATLDGRQDQVRDLLARLDTFVAALDDQRDNIIGAIGALNRLAGTLAAQRDVIARALTTIPPALDVLIRERPRLTTALEKLHLLSDTATRLVNDSQADLVTNLRNLAPTLQALADVGPELAATLAYATTFPFSQSIIDRAVRGDYFNVYAAVDLTVPRLKRTLFLGTRWGQEGASLVPAPGEPWYLNYTKDPIGQPLAPAPDAASVPPVIGPLLPAPTPASGNVPDPIFAGPYDVAAPPMRAGG